MQKFIILALLLLSIAARAETPITQKAQQTRIQGFMLCSNLLVYFNNQDPRMAFDPAAREAYRRNLRELDTLVATLTDNTGISAALDELKASISDLEQQPQDTRRLYTSSINPVLHAQRDLDEAARAAYIEAEQPSAKVASLHQMSLDISRILLLYQGKSFDNIGIHSVESDEHSFERIDLRISSNYKRLREIAPEMNNELDEAWMNYNFVRRHLKANDKGGISHSAILYLGKGVEILELLARKNARHS